MICTNFLRCTCFLLLVARRVNSVCLDLSILNAVASSFVSCCLDGGRSDFRSLRIISCFCGPHGGCFLTHLEVVLAQMTLRLTFRIWYNR